MQEIYFMLEINVTYERMVYIIVHIEKHLHSVQEIL